MPSNKYPSKAPNGAWYDMINSTGYANSTAKQYVDMILSYPEIKYIKYKWLFNQHYRKLMTEYKEHHTLYGQPVTNYNEACAIARARAAHAVFEAVNYIARSAK